MKLKLLSLNLKHLSDDYGFEIDTIEEVVVCVPIVQGFDPCHRNVFKVITVKEYSAFKLRYACRKNYFCNSRVTGERFSIQIFYGFFSVSAVVIHSEYCKFGKIQRFVIVYVIAIICFVVVIYNAHGVICSTIFALSVNKIMCVCTVNYVSVYVEIPFEALGRVAFVINVACEQVLVCTFRKARCAVCGIDVNIEYRLFGVAAVQEELLAIRREIRI